MTRIDAAWLAGVIDGEGYVAPRRIEVTNCDRTLLRHVKQLTGCGYIYPKNRYSAKHTPCFRWVCQAKADVELVLNSVSNYLITKRAKSRAVLKEMKCKSR